MRLSNASSFSTPDYVHTIVDKDLSTQTMYEITHNKGKFVKVGTCEVTYPGGARRLVESQIQSGANMFGWFFYNTDGSKLSQNIVTVFIYKDQIPQLWGDGYGDYTVNLWF